MIFLNKFVIISRETKGYRLQFFRLSVCLAGLVSRLYLGKHSMKIN